MTQKLIPKRISKSKIHISSGILLAVSSLIFSFCIVPLPGLSQQIENELGSTDHLLEPYIITTDMNKKDPALMGKVNLFPKDFDYRRLVNMKPKMQIGRTCWAYTIVAAIEAKYSLATGSPSLNLSEAHLIACNLAGSTTNSGGNIGNVSLYNGRNPFFDRQYNESSANLACSSFNNNGQALVGARTSDVYFLDKTDIAGLKASLINDGPCYISFKVYSNFDNFLAKGGRDEVYMSYGGDTRDGHAVLVIGWSDEKKAFLIQNSWGEYGGPNRDGTFWMSYDFWGNGWLYDVANFRVQPIINISEMPPVLFEPSALYADGAFFHLSNNNSAFDRYLQLSTDQNFSTVIKTAQFDNYRDGMIVNGLEKGRTYFARAYTTYSAQARTGYSNVISFTLPNESDVIAKQSPKALSLLFKPFQGASMIVGWASDQALSQGYQYKVNFSSKKDFSDSITNLFMGTGTIYKATEIQWSSLTTFPFDTVYAKVSLQSWDGTYLHDIPNTDSNILEIRMTDVPESVCVPSSINYTDFVINCSQSEPLEGYELVVYSTSDGGTQPQDGYYWVDSNNYIRGRYFAPSQQIKAMGLTPGKQYTYTVIGYRNKAEFRYNRTTSPITLPEIGAPKFSITRSGNKFTLRVLKQSGFNSFLIDIQEASSNPQLTTRAMFSGTEHSFSLQRNRKYTGYITEIDNSGSGSNPSETFNINTYTTLPPMNLLLQ